MVFIVVGVLLVLAGLAVIVVRTVGAGSPLRGQGRETNRAVRRAIRAGGTDDPEIDRLAREVIRLTPRLRWGKYFYAGMLVLSLGLLVIDHDSTGDIVRHAGTSVLWVGLIVLTVVHERRLDNYGTR
ncbi:hypothetical protein [Actinoplanes sp. NPDC051494]|uniref:hypothetical protein n=1 Tax=Actinoplanes sp. NPDC051494 TaxID=3363907 RepID=UPI0037A05B26